MKPERTIQRMYDMYPELFPSRQAALDHLFVVIGNGYTWCKGELVCDEDLLDYNAEEDEYFDNPDLVQPDLEPDLEIAVVSPKAKEILEKDRAWREYIHNKQHPGEPYDPYKHWWYPGSKEHSLIYKLPDDITPEWKKVAEECKAMMIEDGVYLD